MMRYQEQITSFMNQHMEEYLADLAMLVAIPSVSEERYQASEEAPFGTICVEALDAMMGLCKKYGLPTRTIGKVIGIAEYGEGERELDIVAHLDVQPAGDGWKSDPFKLLIDGDIAYGRGTSDDKGPALAALYAVRALKELGIPLEKKVRLVFGTGEEYAIMDIHHYTDVEPAPPFMFTPDHSYPIVNASKAGYTATLSWEQSKEETEGGTVLEVTGGNNRGAVPGTCYAVLKEVSLEKVESIAKKLQEEIEVPFTVTFDGNNVRVESEGISTHAVKADHGKSAVTAMLLLLQKLGLPETNGHKALSRFSELFAHGDVSGKTSGIYMEDEASGGSLYNIGIFRYTPGKISAKLRVTLPATLTKEQFCSVFYERAKKAQLWVSEEQFSEGTYYPLDDPYVSKLLASYEAYMGEKAFGLAAGGGNYAHAFPRGVAFGCEPYGVDTHMHGAQEFVSISIMEKSACIFAQSILEICGER